MEATRAQAQLTASAMVPPMGQHYLKGTVATSNISLLKVCHGEDVRCGDHTSSFTAYSGAPKQDMYRDPLHPIYIKTPGPVQPGQFLAKQQGASAWQSVPGRLPSVMTPPNQQRGLSLIHISEPTRPP